MKAPEKLIPALRQYRHNNDDDGLVFAYDIQETDKVVAVLQAELKCLHEQWQKVGKNADTKIDRLNAELQTCKDDALEEAEIAVAKIDYYPPSYLSLNREEVLDTIRALKGDK